MNIQELKDKAVLPAGEWTNHCDGNSHPDYIFKGEELIATVEPTKARESGYRAELMVHSCNKFPVLLDGVRKALSYRMQTHHGDDPCIVMLKALIKDAEEVEI